MFYKRNKTLFIYPANENDVFDDYFFITLHTPSCFIQHISESESPGLIKNLMT